MCVTSLWGVQRLNEMLRPNEGRVVPSADALLFQSAPASSKVQSLGCLVSL